MVQYSKDIKHGLDVDVSGGGKVVSVNDVAQAIDLAIGNKEASGKIYNLVDLYVDNMTVAAMAGNAVAQIYCWHTQTANPYN